jgi:hypothetical protein
LIVIIRESDLSKANLILAKYNCKARYSIMTVNNARYVIFDSGVAAALIEIDMKYGLDYKDGRIVTRD